jgi:DNA-binding CsgD family transcriptional regulator
MGAVVGREAEHDAAVRFLDRIAGRSAALVIEGDPGIGKTTVWLEAIATAEARSYRVLQARPSESEAKLAFTGVADLIGTAFDETRAGLPAPQERALAVALLRSDAEQSAELRATATAFVSVLAALAEETPVVVAIDDLQWLDPASERVLAFAARRLPGRVGLLMTLRTDGARRPLGPDSTLTEDLLERVVLEPLSLAALHHLMRQRLELPLARPMLTRLAAASGGNPFFALEIARSLAGDSDGRAFRDPFPVPWRLQELLTARVDALTLPAREVVLAAAALSQPSVATLTVAVGGAATALAEAEDAGVIVVDGDRIQFTHPLLASAVYGLASKNARRQLHRRLAEAVSSLEERARHLALSAPLPDEATAAELERAGRQASRRGAHDAAAELHEASWRLTPAGFVDERARRMLGYAAALNAVGDFAGARSLAEHALDASAAPTHRAAALSLLAGIAWYDGAARTATDLAEQAVAAAGPDAGMQGSLNANLVRFTFAADLERVLVHAEAAEAVLTEEREPGPLAHVLIDRFFASALLARPEPRELLERGLALEAKSLAKLSGDPQPIPLIWFHCNDELESARARFTMEDQWFRERGEEVAVADRRSHLAVAELHGGDWEAASQLVEESCDALQLLDVRGPRAMAFEKRALVDAHRGRIEPARTTLLPLIDEFEQKDQRWWAALALSTLGFLEFAAGCDAASDAALTRMREHALSAGANDVLFDRSEPFHIEVLLALGELDRARETLARLEERGRTLPRLWITATLPRARALVLAAEGDVTAALAAFDELVDAAAEQLPFELACTFLVKGRLQRRAKQKRAAAETLQEALEIFERLGAPLFAARTRGEIARLGLRRSPDALSATELRIAELAAGGLTNREVARAAFVSPKTVEANLARVYRKLGIRSRAELGARMARGQRDSTTQT